MTSPAPLPSASAPIQPDAAADPQPLPTTDNDNTKLAEAEEAEAEGEGEGDGEDEIVLEPAEEPDSAFITADEDGNAVGAGSGAGGGPGGGGNAGSDGVDPMNLDGAHDGGQATAAAGGLRNADEDGGMSVLESRIPVKKDASLREFLGRMDAYAPIIPDAVTNYYLTLAGLPPPPATSQHLARLLALATQKFIADIAADAYQYSRIRSSNTTSNNPMGGLGGAAGFGTSAATGAAGGGAAGGAGAAAGKDGAGAGGQGQGAGGVKGTNLGVQRPGFGGGGQGGTQGRAVLTMEDLGMAVGEYGVNVKRGEFYR